MRPLTLALASLLALNGLLGMPGLVIPVTSDASLESPFAASSLASKDDDDKDDDDDKGDDDDDDEEYRSVA